jgi:hypothetical protein
LLHRDSCRLLHASENIRMVELSPVAVCLHVCWLCKVYLALQQRDLPLQAVAPLLLCTHPYRVHCLEAFSISVSPEGVARPASNWVDIGIRRVTLHLLLGSEQVRLAQWEPIITSPILCSKCLPSHVLHMQAGIDLCVMFSHFVPAP